MLHVVQIGFFLPQTQEHPRDLIEQWRLLEIPKALTEEGVKVSALFSNKTEYTGDFGDVRLQFIREKNWCKRISSGYFPPINIVDRARRLKADVLHVHGLHHASQLLYLRKRMPDIPILVQDHANRPPASLLRRRYHRWSLSKVDTVSFTDLELADEFIRAGILNKNARLRMVQEGSCLFQLGSQVDAQERTGINGSPCCLWVGDLNRNKDPLTALEGFRLALPELPGAKLWMCFRQSPLRGEVENYLGSHPELTGHVTLLGARPHAALEHLHRSADMYISASHREGGAYSVIEALACGNLPIVTNASVFRRLTENGRYGGCFSRGNATELSQQLIQWNLKLSEALRVSLRDWFESSLSNRAIATSLKKVYQELLGS